MILMISITGNVITFAASLAKKGPINCCRAARTKPVPTTPTKPPLPKRRSCSRIYIYIFYRTNTCMLPFLYVLLRGITCINVRFYTGIIFLFMECKVIDVQTQIWYKNILGVEMAQMVKAQVWYARRLGSEFDPMDKNKIFLFQLDVIALFRYHLNDSSLGTLISFLEKPIRSLDRPTKNTDFLLLPLPNISLGTWSNRNWGLPAARLKL